MRYFILFALVLISVALVNSATRKAFLLGKPSQSNDKAQASPAQQSSENQSDGDDASAAETKGNECNMNQGAGGKTDDGQPETEAEESKENPSINPGSSSKKNSRKF